VAFLVIPVHKAQAQESAPTKSADRMSIDFGGERQVLSSHFGGWDAAYLHGVFPQNAANTWNVELTNRAEFGDRGTYFAAGDTHIFNPDWYGNVTVGTSAGGFFLPRYRIDAHLNKKWLKARNLVTTIGYMHDKAKDVHYDHAVEFGAAYYWQAPWIVEGAVRLNVSHPGPVLAESQFIAITHGRDRQRFVVLRVEFGQEGYQLVGPATALTRFQGQDISLTWRQWTHGKWGFNWVAEYYHSPAYARGGITFGIFREF
jgi:YaiO family outer membrane protein